MKKHLIAIALIGVLALSACSNSDSGAAVDNSSTPAAQTTSSVPETTTSETEAEIAETQSDTENAENNGNSDAAVSKENYPDFLIGPDGNKVSSEEITEAEFNGEGEWCYASCEGFTYLSEPTGTAFNSVENPDLLDNENFTFKGAPASAAEYKRYNEGDTVCGLTIKNAKSSFNYYQTNTYAHEERFFGGGSVTFDGTVELTGYIVVLADDEYAVGGAGDVIFILDTESQILPIMNYNAISEEKGVYSSIPEHCFTAGGVTYQSEYPFAYFTFGAEDYTSSSFEPNTPVRVKITAGDIEMSADIDWIPFLRLTAFDIELI